MMKISLRCLCLFSLINVFGENHLAFASNIINISTRAHISGGQNDAFAGFLITGNIPKKVIIRGISAETGVDPKILVLDHFSKAEIGQNDNWLNNDNASEIEKLPSHLQLPDIKDAGLLLELEPGVYDVILSSVGAPGLALVSVDDLEAGNDEKIINISTRANISGGQKDAFAGFAIKGTEPKKVIIRGISVSDEVDPKILVLDHVSKVEIGQNDNWETNENATDIENLASNLQLPNDKDAGLLLDLNPGIYDVILSSLSTPGLALVSVDEIDNSEDFPGIISPNKEITANFLVISDCNPVEEFPCTVTVQDQSSGSVPVTGLFWVFSDTPNTINEGESFSREFSVPGTYQISHLIEADEGNLSDEISKEIIVTESAISFSDSPFCDAVANGDTAISFGLIGNKDKRWDNGKTLKYSVDFSGTTLTDFSLFCDDLTDENDCQERIIGIIGSRASQWTDANANIFFEYISTFESGDIRIQFLKGEGLNSYVGTDAEDIASSKNTMNLQIESWAKPLPRTGETDTTYNNRFVLKAQHMLGTIIHEFGHAIGLKHEQKRSDQPYLLDENQVIAYYEKKLGWTEEKIREQVLTTIDVDSETFLTNEYDDLSIMRYSLRRSFLASENTTPCPSMDSIFCVEPNNVLSFLDRLGIQDMYPYTEVITATQITNIQITSFADSGNHCDDDYTRINVDLNKGAGGNFIFLCFQKDIFLAPLTDIKITSSDSAGNICPANYIWVNVDLNQTVGGKFIYLCASRRTDFSPITAIEITTHPISPENICNLPFRDDTDLNEGVGGDFIYLCYD